MQYSSMALFLIAIAVVSLLTGFEWLAVVFIAIGLALFYYDSQTPAIVEEAPRKKEARTPQQPQQVIVVQQSGGDVSSALAEEIVKHERILEHEVLGKARPQKKN